MSWSVFRKGELVLVIIGNARLYFSTPRAFEEVLHKLTVPRRFHFLCHSIVRGQSSIPSPVGPPSLEHRLELLSQCVSQPPFLHWQSVPVWRLLHSTADGLYNMLGKKTSSRSWDEEKNPRFISAETTRLHISRMQLRVSVLYTMFLFPVLTPNRIFCQRKRDPRSRL